MNKIVFLSVALLLLIGCAVSPPVTLTYYDNVSMTIYPNGTVCGYVNESVVDGCVVSGAVVTYG